MKIVNESLLGIGRQKTSSEIDYVQDNELHMHVQAPNVQIMEEAELDQLPDSYPPGTIGYTAGWKKAWQKAADGQWVAMI